MSAAQTPAPHRPRLSVSERRALLIEGAWTLMKREGVAAATTRAICAEAGMPHGAFHYCFRSKQELYAELLTGQITGGLAEVWAQIDASADVRETILAIFLAYWDQVEADPQAQVVIAELTVLAQRDAELRELSMADGRSTHTLARTMLRQFIELTGVRSSLPDDLLAEMLLGALSGVTNRWLVSRDSATARAALAEYAKLFAGYTQEQPEP
ncbi:TetR/AcrR family transcriptional regulator [Granulicoccus phenolivorans]|uniref:TetR/AcrR family transcriptional regulator n=1 Tax=Granulicoccus phenolivorans TaxID=266854 RepID=UPI0006872341|nr:TetR/AcrR family transcriptional regulator [Granulicoccus phenolivorans]